MMKRVSWTALMLSISLSATVFAQTFSSVTPLFSSASWGERNDLVDLDNDGDLDVLTFTNAARRVLENSNSVFTPVSTPFGATAFQAIDYVLCDFDHDNDVDILYIQTLELYAQKLMVARNNGNLSFSLESVSGITSNWFEAKVYWVDVDADGDSDIIFNDVYQNYSIFLNTSGSFTKSDIALPSNLHALHWSDVNQDGLIDFVASRGETEPDNPVYLFLNTGDAHFEMSSSPFTQGIYNNARMFWMDADLDGDPDLLLQKSNNTVQLFKNKFTETQSPVLELAVTLPNIDAGTALSFGDLNTDGLIDFVTSGGSTILYTNTFANNTLGFQTTNLNTTAGSSSAYLALADFDNDTDQDIIYYQWAGGDPGMVFLKNTSSLQPAVQVPAALETEINSTVTLKWGDITAHDVHYHIELKRDGNLILSTLADAGGKRYVNEQQIVNRNSWLTLNNLPAGNYSWRVQAVDGAGRGSAFSGTSTFVIAEPPGTLTLEQLELTRIKLEWIDNSATETGFAVFRRSETSPLSLIATLPPNTTSFEDSDINLNVRYEYIVKSKTDDVLSAASNVVSVYNEQFLITPFTNPPNIVSYHSVSADLDNDNDYDLLFHGGLNYNYGKLFYLKNNGEGEFSLQTTTQQFGMESSFYVRDIDNDGDQDICIASGSVKILRNDNGQFTQTFQSAPYPYIPQFDLQDFNNDGLVDIIFTHENGNATGTSEYTILYQNTISDFKVSDFHFVPLRNQNLTTYTLGDFNNDSFIDILFAAYGNTPVKAFKNLNGNSFAPVSTNLPSFTGTKPFDYNGDGKLDVIFEGIIYFGGGDFNFSRSTIETAYPSAIADLDLNGIPDLVVGSNLVRLGAGAGEYQPVDFPSTLGSVLTDFENDGDLDLVGLARDQHEGLNSYYKNRIRSAQNEVANVPPSAPDNLEAIYYGGVLTLSWDPAADDKTPPHYISYNLELKNETNHHLVNPETNLSGTFRQRLGAGNLGFGNTFKMNNLQPGHYVARLQAVDASYSLSAFSAVQEFDVLPGIENLAYQKLKLNKIRLFWTENIDNESSIVVERRTVNSDFQIVAQLSPNTTEFTDDNLLLNELYSYRIYAVVGDVTTFAQPIQYSTIVFAEGTSQMPKLIGAADVADFNSDGKMDVIGTGVYFVAGQFEYRTDIYQNVFPAFPVTTAAHTGYHGTYQLFARDFTGDHSLDILQHGFTGVGITPTKFYANNGSQSFQLQSNPLSETPNEIKVMWDFDSDNDLDFYVLDKTSISPTVKFKVLENKAGVYTVVNERNPFCCTNYTLVAGDFDRDGDEDAYESNGNYYRNNGAASMFASALSGSAMAGEQKVVDYNNDGFPDIFVLSSSTDGKGKLFRHKGTLSFGSPQFELALEFPTGITNAVWADFNHDGFSDVAIAGNYRFSVFMNNGNGSFTEIRPASLQEQDNRVVVLDVDNDGDLDIVVSSGNPNVILYNNLINAEGGIVNEPPSVPGQLTSTTVAGGIQLSWQPSSDDTTPATGITYDVIIYDVAGRAITKAAIDPVSGKRLKLERGRLNTTRFVFNPKNITQGFTWTVQAVDNSFKGSALAPVSSLVVFAPIVNDTLIYTCDAPYAVKAKGENIEWFSDENLSVKVHDGPEYSPESTTTLYVTQTISGVRSLAKRITAIIEVRPASPATEPVKNYCSATENSVSLSATGTSLTWYSDENLTQLVSNLATITVPTVDGTTFYVTQKISGCESIPATIELQDVRPEKPAIESIFEYCTRGNTQVELTASGTGTIKWYANESLSLAVATGASFNVVPVNNKTYFVTQTVSSCVSMPSDVTLKLEDDCIITGTEPEWSKSITVFPNPANGKVIITSDQSIKITALEIINSLGQRQMFIDNPQFINGSHEVNVSSLTPGIYMLQLQHKDLTVLRRLVIN